MLRKVSLIATVIGLAVAVPATAKPSSTGSHKCTPHKVAYVASGTLVSWSATKNSDNTYSGTIVVHVTKANHHAKAGKNNDVTYTLDHAKVKLGKGVTAPPVAGDKVKVTGKITHLAKKCNQTGFTPEVTVKKVVVHKKH